MFNSNVLRSSLVALAASAATVQATITFNNCSTQQSTVLTSAVGAGELLLVKAFSFFIHPVNLKDSHYTDWFGTDNAANAAAIQGRIKVLASGEPSTYTYNCSPTTTVIAPGNAFGTFEVGPDIATASAPASGTVTAATHLWLSALVASVTDSFPQLENQGLVTAAETKQFLSDHGPNATVNNGPSYVFFMEGLAFVDF